MRRTKLFFFILFLIATDRLTAQTQWTYSTSPVLAMDTSMWAAYGQPSCIFYKDTLRMYYGVASFMGADTVPRGRIHYAWSLDGINWTKYAGNPVLNAGSPGQWDDEWLDTPEILWDGSEFKLYYYGDSVYMTGAVNASIGLATSPNGLNWTKQGIVLQKGNPGDWDGNFIESPAAYYDASSGVYALWYSAQDTVGWIKIGLAVSADGINWFKDTPNPCLSNGTFNSWDDMFVGAPSVIRSGSVFEMWYSGIKWATQYDSVRAGYAVSLNGRDWIKYPGNPVLYALPNDSSEFWAVDVVWDSANNQYKMWYENKNTTGTPAIFYAASPRTVLFSSNCAVIASNDTAITPNDTIQLFASGGTFYQWNPNYGLNNPNIANPLASPDTTTIYMVLAVSDSCITIDSVLITVMPVSVSAQSEVVQDFNIFPNPVTDVTHIQFTLTSDVFTQIIVQDIQGRDIMEVCKSKLAKGRQLFMINANHLSSGLYYLKIETETIRFFKKIIISR